MAGVPGKLVDRLPASLICHATYFYRGTPKNGIEFRWMSVIATVRVDSNDFELGQILGVESADTIELETLVPMGDATIPLFWAHGPGRGALLESVGDHPTVNDVTTIDVFDDRTLFKLEWDAREDAVFSSLIENDGQVIRAIGTAETWEFEVRFSTHENLSAFTSECRAENIPLELTRVYNPSRPTEGPWYGLTDPQREALTLAVEMGYYDIPRRCTTKALAAELGISDQAVTERLRRAIETIARNTLLVQDSNADE